MLKNASEALAQPPRRRHEEHEGAIDLAQVKRDLRAQIGSACCHPSFPAQNRTPGTTSCSIGSMLPDLSRSVRRYRTSLPQLPAVREARSERLTQAARRLPIGTQTVVLDELSAAGAILAEAESREADCVVVGTRRPSSWLDEFGSRRVATEVIERAACSVIVLPLDQERPASLALGAEHRDAASASLAGLPPFAS